VNGFLRVNHDILLKKLNNYGIRGIANKLLESFLKDRKQFVVAQGTESKLLNYLVVYLKGLI